MSDPKPYSGSCHCGAVRFTVNLDLSGVMQCNCSLCRRRGWLLTFVPADAFTLDAGADHLTEYRFNKKKIAHLFCRTCGVQSFGRGDGPDGKPSVAVNVRCLDGVDLSTLPVKQVDGASF
ncbi:MAG: GFA family protein [Polyangiaceae bacterium]|nr:GFA family protein [Polyangiaceae bacterium]